VPVRAEVVCDRTRRSGCWCWSPGRVVHSLGGPDREHSPAAGVAICVVSSGAGGGWIERGIVGEPARVSVLVEVVVVVVAADYGMGKGPDIEGPGG